MVDESMAYIPVRRHLSINAVSGVLLLLFIILSFLMFSTSPLLSVSLPSMFTSSEQTVWRQFELPRWPKCGLQLWPILVLVLAWSKMVGARTALLGGYPALRKVEVCRRLGLVVHATSARFARGQSRVKISLVQMGFHDKLNILLRFTLQIVS